MLYSRPALHLSLIDVTRYVTALGTRSRQTKNIGEDIAVVLSTTPSPRCGREYTAAATVLQFCKGH